MKLALQYDLNKKDGEECLAIYISGSLESLKRPISPEKINWSSRNISNAFLADLYHPYNKVILARSEKEIAGFIILYFPEIHPVTGNYQLLIKEFHVKKEFRGSRVCSFLYQAMEAYAKEVKAEYTVCNTGNQMVLKGLLKRGFIVENIYMSRRNKNG